MTNEELDEAYYKMSVKLIRHGRFEIIFSDRHRHKVRILENINNIFDVNIPNELDRMLEFQKYMIEKI